MAGKHSAGAHARPQAQPQAQARTQARPQARRRSRQNEHAMNYQYVPQTYGYEAEPRRRRGFLPVLLALTLIAAIAGAGYYFIVVNPSHYDITVNGVKATVERDATIADVIEAGHASPKPGNLMAIDGSLAKEGAGNPFAAKVNGTETTDPATVLKSGDKLEIADGTDATEEFDEQEETIAHGTVDAETDANAYWGGSLHVFQAGEDGLKVTRTGKVSGKTITEETKPAKDAGYRVYTADPGDDKAVAITFDDGPWPETTDQILDVLEESGAKATFFTIGNQIADHVSQIKREHQLGCQVCTHTWDHASGSGQGVNVTYMSAEEQVQEVQKGYEAIKEVLGEEPAHVTRMPGGNFYGEAVANLEPYIDCEVGWNVDTEDWRQPGADAIYERLMSVQPGQVILCHDGGGPRAQTVEAVSRAIPELMAQGYKFVTINDLLAYK